MDPTRRRRRTMRVWRIINPLNRPFAGVVPWWVILETRGRKSGRPVRLPMARGPMDGDSVAWLIAVHGDRSAFARNIAADPRVRLKMRGRWRTGTAQLVPWDPATVARFNLYARSARRVVGIDPQLLRIELDTP